MGKVHKGKKSNQNICIIIWYISFFIIFFNNMLFILNCMRLHENIMKKQRIVLMPRKYFSLWHRVLHCLIQLLLAPSLYLEFWAHSSSSETSSFINSLNSVPEAEARWILSIYSVLLHNRSVHHFVCWNTMRFGSWIRILVYDYLYTVLFFY